MRRTWWTAAALAVTAAAPVLAASAALSPATATLPSAAGAVSSWAIPAPSAPGTQPGAPLAPADAVCAPGRSLRDVAALLRSSGSNQAPALRAMAGAGDADRRRCGLRGLAAIRDAEAPSLLAAAFASREWRDDLYLVARWAAFAAGGPEPSYSAAFTPLVDAAKDPAVAAAAGDDLVLLLGEIEAPSARDALLGFLTPEARPATLDAAVHALARQGDPRGRAQIVSFAQTVMNGLGGNATLEEARRLGAAAFYLLALGPDTRDEGLRLLTRLSPADQAETGAWAVQTLCERRVRRPEAAAALGAVRAAVIDALDARGIEWASVPRGTFACPAP